MRGSTDSAAPLVIGLAPLLVIVVSRVLYPYDLGHYEAGTWEPARLLWSGANPYAIQRTLEPPYVMAPYGPAYYAVIGLGLRIFGPQLWFGRAAALSALVLAAACLALLARRFGGRGAGRLAVLAFAAQLPLQAWAAVHRPDTLALALGLAGLTIATARRWVFAGGIVAAVAVALAVLMRQTEVVPALAIPLWLVLERRRRGTLAFLLVLGLLVTGATALLQYSSAGGYLWQQFTLPASVPVGREQLVVVGSLLARQPGTWVVAALMVFGLRARRDAHARTDGAAARSTDPEGQRPDASSEPAASRRHFEAVLAGAFIAATLVALVTSARRGSNANYWLEPSALLAVGVAIAFGRARTRAARRRYVVAVWALAIASAAGTFTFARAELDRWAARPYLDAIVGALRDVEPRDASVLSVYPELAVYAGRSYVFNDGIQYDGRSEPHHALLMRTLREKSIPALVLPFAPGPRGYTRVALDAPGADVAGVYLFVRDDP